MNTETNRSSVMNLMNEDLARAQMAARLGEAQSERLARRLIAARRMSRRAERAALQARLALARSI
jgi:hypothetical protein